MEAEARRAWSWVAAASLLHLLLGGIRLGSESVWLDELMSIQMVTGTWQNLWGWFLFLPEQHPLYYLLLRPWLAVLGDSAAALRSLSLVFGVAAVPVMYLLGRDLVDARTGVVSAFLMALSPFWLFYSQEGRMYTLLVLLACISTWLFVRHLKARDSGTPAPLGWYWLVSTLGMYTHFFFVFVLFGHAAVYLLDRASWRKRITDVLRLGVPVFLAYLPWLVMLAVGLSGEQEWKSVRTVIFAVPYTFVRFAVGYGTFVANYQWQEHVGELLRENAPVLALAVAAHALLALAGMWAWSALRPTARRVLWATLVVPLLLPLALSVITILAGERYFMVALPAYLIALATGLVHLLTEPGSARRLGMVGAAALAWVTVYALQAHYLNPEAGKEQWHDVVAELEARVGEDDAVYVAPAMSRAGLLYHSEHLRPENVLGLDPEDSPDLTAAEGDTAWLVVARLFDPETMAAQLAPRWRPVEETLYPKTTGIWVIRLQSGDRLP